MKPIALYVTNGILNLPSSKKGCTDRAKRWVKKNRPSILCDTYEYFAGAITRMFGQGKRVREISAKIAPIARAGSHRIRLSGHSNGAELMRRVLVENTWLKIEELHLIGAAADYDFEKNGLAKAYKEGRVRKIVCQCSKNDHTLSVWAEFTRKLLGWAGLGYGTLGLVGPHRAPFGSTQVIWRSDEDPTLDHSDYFDPGKRLDETMRIMTR